MAYSINDLLVCLRTRKYKQALVTLWRQSQDDAGDGTKIFQAQWKPHYDAGRHSLRTQELADWLDGGCVPQQEINDPVSCMALISALDDLLAERNAHALHGSFIEPIVPLQGGAAYTLLPRTRAPGAGYLYKPPATKLHPLHPKHLILPAMLSHNEFTVPIIVREAHAWGGWPERLRVAVTAFTDLVELTSRQSGANVLYVGTSDEEARYRSALALIERALAEGVHILVFPELTLTPENQRRLADELNLRRLAGEISSLELVCLGSFHEADRAGGAAEQVYNRARLLSGRDGRECLRQDKFQAASDSGYMEGFVPARELQALLHPMGFMAIAICKDLFDEDAAWLWRDLTTEWLFTPSMSNTLARHREHTDDLWKRHQCITLVANQPYTVGQAGCSSYIQHARQPAEADGDLLVVEIVQEIDSNPVRPKLRIVR